MADAEPRHIVLFVIDGLGDVSVRALGGRTPLQAAATPCLDALVRASSGLFGLLDPVALWQHQNFPGKRATQYRSDRVENRDATHALAVSSASMLRRSVRIEPAELGALRFSWRVPALIASADLGDRDLADSPVNRNVKPTAEAAEALTWGKAQIDSLVFMKPDMVARERAGWVTAWNRMIAK